MTRLCCCKGMVYGVWQTTFLRALHFASEIQKSTQQQTFLTISLQAALLGLLCRVLAISQAFGIFCTQERTRAFHYSACKALPSERRSLWSQWQRCSLQEETTSCALCSCFSALSISRSNLTSVKILGQEVHRPMLFAVFTMSLGASWCQQVQAYSLSFHLSSFCKQTWCRAPAPVIRVSGLSPWSQAPLPYYFSETYCEIGDGDFTWC